MGAENLGKSAVTRLDFRKTEAMGPKIYLDFHLRPIFYGNLAFFVDFHFKIWGNGNLGKSIISLDIQ